MRNKSEKLIVIRDFRQSKGTDEPVGMAIITASNGRDDEEAEKYAIYNKKWKNAYEFATGVENKSSISIELYDAITVK